MGGDVLELEARLKDYISGNMTSITDALERYGKKFEEAGERQRKSEGLMSTASKDLADSWNVARIAVTGMVGAMGAMEVFNRVTGFVKMGREEAKEYIEVAARMKASLGFVSAELNSQATIIGNKLVIDDEEIKKIQTQISYFTKNEDQIKRLTKASLDFSAATGGSGLSVARAIEMNSRELQRYGIRINSAEGSLERVEEIIQKVNQRFGGQAEAVAESKDWWDRFSLSVSNAGEKLGLLLRGKGGDLTKEYFRKVLTEGTVENIQASYETIKKAEEVLASEIAEKRKAKYNETIDANFRSAEEAMQRTASLEEAMLSQTTDGKIILLQKQKAAEIAITGTTAEQKYLIEQRYNIQIDALRQQQSSLIETQEKKRTEDYKKFAQDRLEIERNLQDAMLAIQDENDDAARSLREARIESLIRDEDKELAKEQMRWEDDLKKAGENKTAKELLTKAHDQRVKNIELKSNNEKKDADKDLTKQKIENAETITSMTLGTISTLARATKASAGVQKTIDVAQASANTAIAVTKALAAGQPWLVPFYIAMGTAQVALIASQKYGGGGIVGGGSSSQGDVVPAMLTPGEMVLNDRQQAALFNMLQPTTNNITNRSLSNNQNISLNISVAAGGNYDMSAARLTVDSLVPVLGDALVRAKNDGRLRDYEAAR